VSWTCRSPRKMFSGRAGVHLDGGLPVTFSGFATIVKDRNKPGEISHATTCANGLCKFGQIPFHCLPALVPHRVAFPIHKCNSAHPEGSGSKSHPELRTPALTGSVTCAIQGFQTPRVWSGQKMADVVAIQNTPETPKT
jgi:hypothetical protein